VSDAGLTYAGAGVDIDAAESSKHRIKALVESTFTAGARGAFGGFGGMFRVPAGARAPLLVSSGLHTNGYSLARRIVNERLKLAAGDVFPGDTRTTADVLLAVHRSYLRALAPVRGVIHAMAHITGGGLPGNLDRSLPPTLDAVVDTASWQVPNVFRVLGEAGGVARDEMFRAFNMGVGMVVITDASGAARVRASATAAGVESWMLGEVVAGTGRVILTGGI
jgi:phosphoribosylformylglycinamidine cyclo-ligase